MMESPPMEERNMMTNTGKRYGSAMSKRRSSFGKIKKKKKKKVDGSPRREEDWSGPEVQKWTEVKEDM